MTDIPAVSEADEVVLVGNQGNAYIGLDELAEISETISYELSCALAPRVPRLYYRGGTLINATTLLGHEDLSPSAAQAAPGASVAPTPSDRISFKRGTTPLSDPNEAGR